MKSNKSRMNKRKMVAVLVSQIHETCCEIVISNSFHLSVNQSIKIYISIFYFQSNPLE